MTKSKEARDLVPASDGLSMILKRGREGGGDHHKFSPPTFNIRNHSRKLINISIFGSRYRRELLAMKVCGDKEEG